MVRKVVESGIFESYKVNEDIEASLLQFGDDTMVVGSGCWKNFWGIKVKFRGFELVFVLYPKIFSLNLLLTGFCIAFM